MIFDQTQCQLGEGPLWHPTRKQLFWFDILGKRLHTKGRHWQFDNHVSAAGWIDQDSLLIATDNALRHFDIATGKHRAVCPLEADNPVTRSNDGRADPQGGFWIGTMGINAEEGAGAIYRYYKGELRQLFAPISISNAICFAPDGKAAYFTDTPTQKIMRVAGYNPEGTFLESFNFAGCQSSCPAFGGDDLTTLFCTTAAVGLDGPEHGKTFSCETTYKGQAEHRVIL